MVIGDGYILLAISLGNTVSSKPSASFPLISLFMILYAGILGLICKESGMFFYIPLLFTDFEILLVRKEIQAIHCLTLISFDMSSPCQYSFDNVINFSMCTADKISQ